MSKKINVIILTGFLGTGKTSVLNHLLELYRHEKNMVIENEFGAISVDSGLVEITEERVFELNNGCICCSLGEELYAVLREMVQMKAPPDNVFIEASGMADPGALASVFMMETVSEYFQLSKVIGVVDAAHFEDSLQEIPESGRQLAIADLILINKSDRVTAPYVGQLKSTLAAINPMATVDVTQFGQLTLEMLELEDINSAQVLEQGQYRSKHEHSDVKSVVLDFGEGMFDEDRLRGVLTVSLFLHYHQIYRIKGFLKIVGKPSPFLVESAGQQLSMTPFESDRAIAPSKLVVIGKDVTEKGLKKLLGKALLHPIASKEAY